MTQPAESPRPQRHRPFCRPSATRSRIPSSTRDPSLAGMRSYVRPALVVDVAAGVQDPRHSCQRVTVVEQCGPAPRSLDRRERRPGTRLGALALERFEQCGLLAADVSAVAAIELDV